MSLETLSELAPVGFTVLLTLAITAIAAEIVVALSTRRHGPSAGLSRIRRAARLGAPLSLMGAGLILAGLSLSRDGSEAPAPTGAAPTPTPGAPVLIATDGIGAARAGMSRTAVRAALPAGHVMGERLVPFMVDVDGVPVTADGDTIYVLLYPAGEPDGEDAAVVLVATTSPRARTEEDIGPGTSLAEARVRYGAPRLSYHTMDESREYASFPDQPGEGIRFRVSGADGGFAGTYASDGEFRETTTYDPGARITMVVVRLQP